MIPQHTIRQDLLELLKSDYEILDYGFCLRRPEEMLQWCKKWQNSEFSPNERLIFINDDVDFYTDKFSPGFSNYNFFKCCQYFNLPTDFVLYITTHIGIHKEISDLCTLMNLPVPTVIETHNFSRMMPSRGLFEIDYNNHLITKPYVFAAGVQRNHRVMLLSYLRHYQLLDRGHISYHFDVYDSHHKNTNIKNQFDAGPSMRTTVPWQGVNEEFYMSDHDHMVWSNHSFAFIDQRQTFASDTHKFEKHQNISEHQPKFIQLGLVNLIAETYFDFPYPALSEKTFKAIFCKRAFIIAGPKNSLRTIQNLGFKTFDNFWDESYDQEEVPTLRLEKILTLIQKLCKMEATEIQDLSDKIASIAEYNYNHYVNFHQNAITIQRY